MLGHLSALPAPWKPLSRPRPAEQVEAWVTLSREAGPFPPPFSRLSQFPGCRHKLEKEEEAEPGVLGEKPLWALSPHLGGPFAQGSPDPARLLNEGALPVFGFPRSGGFYSTQAARCD